MNPERLNDMEFLKAIKDYYYLIDRNYPEKGSLKLVGDHYKLTGDQRSVLYRGISPESKAKGRRGRIVKNIKDKTVIIDSYNIIFTLLNYRRGKFVFIGNDNLCRDAGELHGKIRNIKYFYECLIFVFDFLSKNDPEYVRFFLDAPVSHSQKHKELIELELIKYNLKGSCHIERSADHHIKRSNDGIIATSDTMIIDTTGNSIIDIPRIILEQRYKVKLYDIHNVLFS